LKITKNVLRSRKSKKIQWSKEKGQKDKQWSTKGQTMIYWYMDATTTLLTTTNICDTNDHGYFPFAVISLFMTYNQFNKNNTKVSLEEWELLIFLEHIPSLTVVSGVRVARCSISLLLESSFSNKVFCRSILYKSWFNLQCWRPTKHLNMLFKIWHV
jgi:hypothetical protein